MKIHHDKHHAAYVDNLNKVCQRYPDLSSKSIEGLLNNTESLPEDIRQTVINNGGGHANHSFFWKIMCPKTQSGEPKGELKETFESTFGSLVTFKEEFVAKAMGVFGSGWAFLIKTKNGKLSLKRHSFQNSPLMLGNIPILGIDVWEHAYYLKYQNRKADYIKAWWNVVNWDEVERRLKNV